MKAALPLLFLLLACGSGRKELRAADGTSAAPGDMSLTLVTFNVQDLFVADRRVDRMRAIGRELARIRPDFIALQEAFSGSHRKELETELETAAGETYNSIYFPSGTMGSGLFVLTRHKIERAVFWRYSSNGAWYQVKHGDWYAGKGVALVRIGIEGAGSLDVLNTHCIANYLEASYQPERTIQIQELMRFVQAEATTPAPTFLLGDLNAMHSSSEFQPIDAVFEDPVLTLVPEERSRIDHILVRPHPDYSMTPWEFFELESGTDDSGQSIRLSDHLGMVLKVHIKRVPKESSIED